jgi:periplasmic divalent cation tolerance protein
MDTSLILVLITVPNEETGETLALRLLDQKLAACVNLVPGVRSLYRWQGEIQDDREWLLLVKTRRELFQEKLVPVVQELHPYQTPEIIAFSLDMGSADYLAWLRDETMPS